MRQGRPFTPIGRPAAGAAPPLQMHYVLAEVPCPYLPGRRERKVITEISGPGARWTYDRLSRAGFRRSHQFAYRPACAACSACVPVRVRAAEFGPSRSLRRIARINQDLRAAQRPPRAIAEHFELFRRYIAARHGEGEMASMGFADYRGMVEHSRVDTRLVEFRDGGGRLVAVCLADWLADGPSAVYSWFDPDQTRRSLGAQVVLWLIEAARCAAQPYVYLGYWIRESPKMAYKARFRPLEGLGLNGWTALDG